jgi:hypothetical protein|tara:strand:- start:42 stop:326 length:285 start_codon:yes stop_codon:yes gene_type:complete
MQYLNSENKTLIIPRVPVSNVDVKVDFHGNLVATIIMEVEDFEKLETQYRGLIQDTLEKMHNYQECYQNNSSCSFEPCIEFKSELNSKYIEMNR